MPEQETLERAHEDAAEGKSPSTQAGEFVREEIEHVREGKHGARSTKQAIAIGLSKARRAGVKLPLPGSSTSKQTRRKARQDSKAAAKPHKPSPKRSRAVTKALKREQRSSASPRALSRQAHQAAASRGRKNRLAAAKKAAQTRKRNR
jgi:Family of unknown function (DUF6496)